LRSRDGNGATRTIGDMASIPPRKSEAVATELPDRAALAAVMALLRRTMTLKEIGALTGLSVQTVWRAAQGLHRKLPPQTAARLISVAYMAHADEAETKGVLPILLRLCKSGLTLRDISRRAGVSYGTICKLSAGRNRTRPKRRTVERLIALRDQVNKVEQ